MYKICSYQLIKIRIHCGKITFNQSLPEKTICAKIYCMYKHICKEEDPE